MAGLSRRGGGGGDGAVDGAGDGRVLDIAEDGDLGKPAVHRLQVAVQLVLLDDITMGGQHGGQLLREADRVA